jgi:hypothetical protein
MVTNVNMLEQELLTLPKRLSSYPVFSGVCIGLVIMMQHAGLIIVP